MGTYPRTRTAPGYGGMYFTEPQLRVPVRIRYRVLAAAEGASPVTVLPGPWLLWIRVSPMVTFSPGQWRQDGNSHPLGLHRVVTRSAHTDPDTEVCSSLIPSYDSFFRAKEFQ